MRNETDRPPAASSEEFSHLASAVLAARLPAASPWMPRREMEELLRRGPSAVAAVVGGARRAPGPGGPLVPRLGLRGLRPADGGSGVGALPLLAEGRRHRAGRPAM